jgi:hypothetical protein
MKCLNSHFMFDYDYEHEHDRASAIPTGASLVVVLKHPPPAQSVKTGGPESLFLSG